MSKQTPEAGFWAWFEAHQDLLFRFEGDQDRVFSMLRTAMHRVHPCLTFEFGQEEGGRRDFVISADGRREAFAAVGSLSAAAPSLPRWRFIKFRPRRPPMDIRVGGIKVRHEDVEVALEADGGKAGLTVFVRGFDRAREEQYQQAVFLMLDQTIGEYDMETKVGFIAVGPFGGRPQYRRHPLDGLPAVFDGFMKR
jgi:hypothetical protein